MALLKENRWPWSPWSAESFQETRKNENQESWSPWSASENLWSEVVFQKKKKNENQQNSHFATFENFSTVAGSLGEMQSKLGSSETDQSMIFQNIINENRLKNSQNFCPLRDFTSRKRNRRNRKRNRPMHQNTNDATVNSFHGLRQQQDHQRWNHVPVLDWSQSNLSPRSIKMNFQNSVRAGSFNERDKNPRRYLYSKRSKFTKASTNVSGFTSEASSRANFKSHNPTNISAGTSTMGNIAYDSTLDGIKSATNITKMEKRNRTQTKSSSSKNLENNEDDVIYLFSVDSSSQDKVILEIDLESNTEHLHSNRNSKEAVNLTRKSKVNL